jgi:hypothetical protein
MPNRLYDYIILIDMHQKRVTLHATFPTGDHRVLLGASDKTSPLHVYLAYLNADTTLRELFGA